MPKIVCITGIDGSGKTSQLKMLKLRLESAGITCRYAHLRVGIFRAVSWPLLQMCKSLGWIDKDETHHPALYRNTVVRKVWPWIFLVDFIVFFAYSTRLFYDIGFNTLLLCDRYVYDVIVDLSIASRDEEFLKNRFSSVLLRFPRPQVAILLDVPEDVAMSRKDDVDDLEYLKRRRDLYLQVAKACDMEVIYEQNFTKINEEIFLRLLSNGLLSR